MDFLLAPTMEFVMPKWAMLTSKQSVDPCYFLIICEDLYAVGARVFSLIYLTCEKS